MHSTKEYVQIKKHTPSLLQWLFIIRSKEKKRNLNERDSINQSDLTQMCVNGMLEA